MSFYIRLFYLLNRRHDCGDDEHDSERDHDPVREVVHAEEEAEVSDGDEDEGLEEGVGHVVLHPPTEHHLHLRRRERRVVHADLEIFQLNLVLDQIALACGGE